MARVYKACVICKGRRGQPRNGKTGKTCSANQCKLEYKEQRAQRGIAPTDGLANDIAAQAAAEAMPDGMWVHEIEEILGERCCELHTLSKKKRKNGPGSAYRQEYLVRGTFLEEDEDDEDEDDDTPEPNTFWVEKGVLLDTIAKSDVKAALEKRHKRVLSEL
jgi:hypothetical protein